MFIKDTFKYTKKDAYDSAAYQLLANPSGIPNFVATNFENGNYHMLEALCKVGGCQYVISYIYHYKVFAIFIKSMFFSKSQLYSRTFPWDKISTEYIFKIFDCSTLKFTTNNSHFYL